MTRATWTHTSHVGPRSRLHPIQSKPETVQILTDVAVQYRPKAAWCMLPVACSAQPLAVVSLQRYALQQQAALPPCRCQPSRVIASST